MLVGMTVAGGVLIALLIVAAVVVGVWVVRAVLDKDDGEWPF